MAANSTIPMKISDYYILPISLPPLASLPTPATHYLYLRPDEPKLPTPTTPRSLFLVNVPFDATDVHIKHLFSEQLDLPNGRIEDVVFQGTKASTSKSEGQEALQPQNYLGKKSKKRKREAEVENLEILGVGFPSTWDRELHKSGSTAVVVFVDRASMEAVVKATRRSRKEEKNIVWGQGLEGKIPALGSASMFMVAVRKG